MMEVPVYLFTGFLGAGKTSLIQEALGDRDFCEGESTLLLLCEEGEVEYDPSRFCTDEIYTERVRRESDLNKAALAEMLARHRANRVIVEWNGMWDLNTLYDQMPPSWMIYQQMMLVEAGMFLMYNQNIRQQTFEQLKGAEAVIFNRCKRDEKFEEWQLQVHKICRVANRRSQIVYEFDKGQVIPDTIQDPLPYDMSKKFIRIEDEDFAEWYRDINENDNDYEGKELEIKGRIICDPTLASDCFAFGRHVMTCCEADIQFAGLICKYDQDEIERFTDGQWARINAEVKIEYVPEYRARGPVLYCKSVSPEGPCVPEVATF